MIFYSCWQYQFSCCQLQSFYYKYLYLSKVISIYFDFHSFLISLFVFNLFFLHFISKFFQPFDSEYFPHISHAAQLKFWWIFLAAFSFHFVFIEFISNPSSLEFFLDSSLPPVTLEFCFLCISCLFLMAYLHIVHISVAWPSFSCFCIQISVAERNTFYGRYTNQGGL